MGTCKVHHTMMHLALAAKEAVWNWHDPRITMHTPGASTQQGMPALQR
jgi:hypothetical protein